MTYEVQQTRYDRIIRRVTGSIGPGSCVSESISELFPMVDVERVPAELLLLGGTQLAMGQTRTAAAAALFAQSMLRNPAGSGNIITVTQVAIFSPTAQQARAGLTLNTLANAGTKTIRDGRRGPAGQPVGDVLEEGLLVAGPLFFRFQLNGTDTYILEADNALAVLPPGTAYEVSSGLANADLNVGWMWRERPAEESELSLE